MRGGPCAPSVRRVPIRFATMPEWRRPEPIRSPRSSLSPVSPRPSTGPATRSSGCTTTRSTVGDGRRPRPRRACARRGRPRLSTGRRRPGPATPWPVRCWPVRCASRRSRAACWGSGAPRPCRPWPGCTCSPPPTSAAEPELGRPRPDAQVAARLGLLADLVTGGTAAPAPVVVAVVHGELLTLAPFGSADGVVARAAARLAAVATGLDPKGLAVPEVGHLRHAGSTGRRRWASRGNRRRGRRVGAALLRAVGGGGAGGPFDRGGPASVHAWPGHESGGAPEGAARLRASARDPGVHYVS